MTARRPSVSWRLRLLSWAVATRDRAAGGAVLDGWFIFLRAES